MSKTFTVEKDFIVAAHASACSEWKEKLEKKFPEAFKTNDVIGFLKEKIGLPDYSSESMFVYGDYLAIVLPNANKEWTFNVWEYIKKICDIDTGCYECYPVHGKSEKGITPSSKYDKNENYQVVNISALKKHYNLK